MNNLKVRHLQLLGTFEDRLVWVINNAKPANHWNIDDERNGIKSVKYARAQAMTGQWLNQCQRSVQRILFWDSL